MDLRRIGRMRGPLVAAICTLLLAGGSVALATDPTTPASPPAANTENPPGATDGDTLQQGDQTTLDSAPEQATAGAAVEAEPVSPETDNTAAEADGPAGHADDPNDPNADHQFEGEE